MCLWSCYTETPVYSHILPTEGTLLQTQFFKKVIERYTARLLMTTILGPVADSNLGGFELFFSFIKIQIWVPTWINLEEFKLFQG